MTDSSPAHKRLHAIVTGRVQGVNFRYYTSLTAQRLGLTGWVANRRDGAVEAVAEGLDQQLQAMIDFLHQGPPSASVSQVDVHWETATGEFSDFGVRYI